MTALAGTGAASPYRPAARPAPVTVAPFAVAGWGTALPPTRVSNAALEARLDTSDEWIRERTGIAERRLASPGCTTAGLAIEAGAAALREARLSIEDVDLIVVATSTPEAPMPPTASFVAAALWSAAGATGARRPAPGTVDVNGACAGFPYALALVGSHLASGLSRCALLVGSETMSRIVDPEDRATAVIFGDGAAALVLRSLRGAGPRGAGEVSGNAEPGAGEVAGLIAADLVSDPGGVDLLSVPAGGAARPATASTVAAREHFVRMEGREVFRRAVRAVVDSLERTLAGVGLDVSDLDAFAPHQANARIVDAVCARTGIPATAVLGNIERFGNTSAASIPLLLAEAATAGRLRDGDLIAMSGFGAGLTVGTVLIRWGTWQ